MKLSDGVEWAIHCCTVLAVLPPDRAMPASRLAEYHGVPGAYLAKHLQALSRHGIIESVSGPRGGYRLARPASKITVLDVVQAIEGAAPAFRCAEIRQRGPAAVGRSEYRAMCGIHRVMHGAEEAWRRELASHTIAELVHTAAVDASPKALTKATAWFQEVLR